MGSLDKLDLLRRKYCRCGAVVSHISRRTSEMWGTRGFVRCDRVKRSLGFARLFRPTYAGANVEHPSYSSQLRPTPPDSVRFLDFYDSSGPYPRVRLSDHPRFLVPLAFRAVEIRHLSRTAYDADNFDGWIATLVDACAWGLRTTGCGAAGAAEFPAQAGLETGSAYSHCGEEGRVGTTVVGSAMGCGCGTGVVSGDAIAESCPRCKNVLPAIRQHGRGR